MSLSDVIDRTRKIAQSAEKKKLETELMRFEDTKGLYLGRTRTSTL